MDNSTIVTLKGLLAARQESEHAYRTCSVQASSKRLRGACARLARRCADSVRELQALIRQLGDDSAPSGHPDGHRALPSADKEILAACERGEDRLLEVYRTALDDLMPEFVRHVVMRQFESVMSNYDQLRRLRDLPTAQKAPTRNGEQAPRH